MNEVDGSSPLSVICDLVYRYGCRPSHFGSDETTLSNLSLSLFVARAYNLKAKITIRRFSWLWDNLLRRFVRIFAWLARTQLTTTVWKL